MPDPKAPSFRRALGHRSFFLLWLAQLISQSGDFIFEVALLWLVLQSTGSVLDVGIVLAATLIPAVVLGPFLGVLIDRWDRRRILIATNALQGIVVALLAISVAFGFERFDLLLGVVVFLGAGGMTVRVATGALVPATVGLEDLAPANSLLSFSNSSNQVVGLAIGGVAVAVLGVTVPIEYDALTFFAAALLLTVLPLPIGAPAPDAEDASPGTFRTQFREGWRFLRSQRYLVELVLVGMAVNFFGNLVGALFAPYAYFVLHGSAATYGTLGAVVAVGSILGALLVGKLDIRRAAGVCLFVGGIAVSITVLTLGLIGTFPLAVADVLGIGIAVAVTNIPLSIVIQAKVPGRLLGRVGAVLGSLIALTAPVGSYVAGAFAQATSVRTAMVVSGLAMTVIMTLGFVLARALRTVTY